MHIGSLEVEMLHEMRFPYERAVFVNLGVDQMFMAIVNLLSHP